jgi:hypothetical protein
MEIEITRLNLRFPLYYTESSGVDPFDGVYSGETLFCFELDEAERLNFEPDGQKLFGKPLFGGKAAEKSAGNSTEKLRELPPGNYLFAQKREILGKEDIVSLAVEIQQEALWQRLEPEKKLYIRRLFEDGSCVTQLFRPYTEPPDDV